MVPGVTRVWRGRRRPVLSPLNNMGALLDRFPRLQAVSLRHTITVSFLVAEAVLGLLLAVNLVTYPSCKHSSTVAYTHACQASKFSGITWQVHIMLYLLTAYLFWQCYGTLFARARPGISGILVPRF